MRKAILNAEAAQAELAACDAMRAAVAAARQHARRGDGTGQVPNDEEARVS